MENDKPNTVSKSSPVPNEILKPLPIAEPSKLKSFLNHRKIWLMGALLIVAASWFGYKQFFGKTKEVYTTAGAERGDIENTVVAAGIVQPIKYVDVGAQTSGKLKSLKVKRGDHVTEGQLLAEIDPVLAKTSLTSANATLENMTSQRTLKEAQLVLTRLQKNRNDQLFAKQLIAASERDITQANYEVASADSSSLSAQMKQASASVNTAKANLNYTKITASMTGEVVSVAILEGQTINSNQTAPIILRIADMTTMTVWSQVSEADIVNVKTGQDVYFTVLGQSRHWDGKIRQILPTPELISNVVFYDVLFDIPNPDGELKIQMTAQVYIVLEKAKNVLLVPTSAIGNAAQGSNLKIEVLKSDGKIETRTIRIGIRSDIVTEVKTGLAEKELVVIRQIVTKAKKKSALSARKR